MRFRMIQSTLATAKVAGILLATFLCLTGCAAAPGGAVMAGPYSMRWVDDSAGASSNRATVEVAGIDPKTAEAMSLPEWQNPERMKKVLAVFAGAQGAEEETPAMLGSYQVSHRTLRFTPAYPLSPGVNYRAVFHPDSLPGGSSSLKQLALGYKLAPSRNEPAIVKAIYPSADVLPENLLKFYVHFSAPMSRGEIYRHIHLRRVGGSDIELPFLELGEELWNPEMTRVTLLFDPGRIKRGVTPQEEIGPALEQGNRYDLIIDRAWLDATGRPMKQEFRKRFSVGSPDRTPVDPARWKRSSPQAGSTQPLTIQFGEALDHALATRMIRLRNPSGASLDGDIELRDSERTWVFTPNLPWRSDRFELIIPTTIEDLAGNNIGKAFDVDTSQDVERTLTSDQIAIPIVIR